MTYSLAVDIGGTFTDVVLRAGDGALTTDKTLTTHHDLLEGFFRGVDQVLGVDLAFGLGYGLKSPTMPLGPRGCCWGGFGGSVIIMDQDLELTIAYMMNKMQVGLVGDTRGSELALAAAMAAMA